MSNLAPISGSFSTIFLDIRTPSVQLLEAVWVELSGLNRPDETSYKCCKILKPQIGTRGMNRPMGSQY